MEILTRVSSACNGSELEGPADFEVCSLSNFDAGVMRPDVVDTNGKFLKRFGACSGTCCSIFELRGTETSKPGIKNTATLR